MRIARYESGGHVRHGTVDPESGEILEIAAADPFGRIEATGVVRRLEAVRLLAPVVPGKIVAVGLNYRDHAREMGKEIPGEPLLFLKAPSALNDPGGAIVYPAQSRRVDYEAELAVVIGRKAKNVKEKDATAHILGYTCINDVTARDLQVLDEGAERAEHRAVGGMDEVLLRQGEDGLAGGEARPRRTAGGQEGPLRIDILRKAFRKPIRHWFTPAD